MAKKEKPDAAAPDAGAKKADVTESAPRANTPKKERVPKLEKKNKSRLPRREKKALQKAAAKQARAQQG